MERDGTGVSGLGAVAAVTEWRWTARSAGRRSADTHRTRLDAGASDCRTVLESKEAWGCGARVVEKVGSGGGKKEASGTANPAGTGGSGSASRRSGWGIIVSFGASFFAQLSSTRDSLTRVEFCRCCPSPCSAPCFPSRQAAEAPYPTVVHPLVHTLFPSACGQLVEARTATGLVPATAVCPHSGPGLPSPALPAAGEARWLPAGARARAVSQRHLAVPPSADRSVQC